MRTAIETTNLSKQYGPIKAVSNLNLSVAPGEIYAFLGLNGAGKTTTIRLILGLVNPTAGEIHVLGTRVSRRGNNPWESVGYLVEAPHAYPELTVRENLEAMRLLRPGTKVETAEDMIELLGLAPYEHRRAGTLSHGNAQRLGLAQALFHQPDLLILDEPASGLDPAGIIEIRVLLTKLANDRGVTIFMSSHILGEVARLAHRIGIIHQGRLLQELSIAELQSNRQRKLMIRARDPHAAQAALESAGFYTVLNSDHTIEVNDQYALDHPDEITSRLVDLGHPPTMIHVEEEDLEDYFMRLIGAPTEVRT